MTSSRSFIIKRRQLLILSKSLPLFLAFLALISAAGAQEGASADPSAVLEAEKTFARASSERGIRESFLQFFADDSIIFAPAPTNGKAFYSKYDDKGAALSWEPLFATISKSGDLGVTTGPWQWKKSKTDKRASAFGEFVSVWKKQPDQSWKVIVDVGIDHARPAATHSETQLLSPVGTSGDESELTRKRTALLAALKSRGSASLLDLANEQVRILRDNSLPAVGKNAAKTLLESDPAKVTRKTFGGSVSLSGDLAYRYGSFTSDAEPPAAGYYLTIWQTDRAGQWNILLDLQKGAGAK
jgi:ketosteroid isomerase-like protein